MREANFVKILILNGFIAAHCAVAQLALSISYSYIYNNSIFVFTLFTGLYLMAMGLGVLFIERFQLPRSAWIKLILGNGIASLVLSNPGIIGILFLNEILYYVLRTKQVDLLFLVFPLGVIFTILIGLVSGAELPLFSKWMEKDKGSSTRPIIGVLTSDYFGAFLGVMIFAFLLYPWVGLISTIFIVQLLALLYLDFVYFTTDIFAKHSKLGVWLIVLNGYVMAMLMCKSSVVALLDQIATL